MGLCFFINSAQVKVVVLTKDEEMMVRTKYIDVYIFVCVCVCSDFSEHTLDSRPRGANSAAKDKSHAHT